MRADTSKRFPTWLNSNYSKVEIIFYLTELGFIIFLSLPKNFPVGNQVTVVGDLHGQLADLLTILHDHGLPSLRNMYLFNGDIVDRGKNSCEVISHFTCFCMYCISVENPVLRC